AVRRGCGQPTAEADRGRHPGVSSFKVFAGSPGSLAERSAAEVVGVEVSAVKDQHGIGLFGNIVHQLLGRSTQSRRHCRPAPADHAGMVGQSGTIGEASFSVRYLLTWNCKHLANAQIAWRISVVCEKLGHNM